MSTRTVTPDELSAAIADEFKKYSDEVAEECKAAVKDVAKRCRNEVKTNSPVESGEYRDGWATSTSGNSATSIRVTVYNKRKPGLAHLLENGHVKRGGGRVEGHPHIGPAEAKANDELYRKIKEVCRK